MRVSKRAVFTTAALLALASCDSPLPTDALDVVPQHAHAASRGNVQLVKTAGWNEQDATNDAVIGKRGGDVRVGGHGLIVPPGVVQHPTRFTMTVKRGDNVIVQLTALDLVTGQAITTFPRDLQVQLSYASVAVISNEWHNLVVVWLKDESASGALLPVRTSYVVSERLVVGWVNHFSKFAMGMN